jgi:hypothetical protein
LGEFGFSGLARFDLAVGPFGLLGGALGLGLGTFRLGRCALGGGQQPLAGVQAVELYLPGSQA